MEKIIKNLVAPPVQECFELQKNPKETMERYLFSKGISPYSLFLYLFSRFGEPNGLLSLVREENSDQLFHWHYSLYIGKYNIEIMCSNYEIDIFASKYLIKDKDECKIFLQECVKDIKNYKDKIATTKKNIENWEMIINPFARLQKQINILVGEIENNEKEIESLHQSYNDIHVDLDIFTKIMNLVEENSSKIFALKCLIPVYIETFINLILSILCKPEIKNNHEKFESIKRKNINEKISSLHENCIGFNHKLDYTDEVFKKIYTIFNKRNDLLHGNFIIKDLKYGDVSFKKNMPLFKKFVSFEEQILHIALSSGQLKDILENIDDTQMFMRYMLLDLKDNTRFFIKNILESYTLGYNKEENRFGVLFPNQKAKSILK